MFTYTHQYYGNNNRLSQRSGMFERREDAVAWAAEAATKAGYHSKVFCAATTLRDDGTPMETVTTEVGAVMPGETTMLERLDSRTAGYPTW